MLRWRAVWVWWGAGGLAGVIPGSVLSACSQDAPRSRDHAWAGTQRHVDGPKGPHHHRSRDTGREINKT